MQNLLWVLVAIACVALVGLWLTNRALLNALGAERHLFERLEESVRQAVADTIAGAGGAYMEAIRDMEKRLTLLTDMAEFAGEQGIGTNFLEAVRDFKKAQAEAVRRLQERAEADRLFKENLDAKVAEERDRRARQARVARARFAASDQAGGKEQSK